MEAKKITKKEFISLLLEKESALIGSCYSKNELHTRTSEAVKTFKPDLPSMEFRTVSKTQTNAIKFSNNSWLYFDQKGEKSYYRLSENVIYMYEISTNADGESVHNIIVYYLK